MPLDALVVGAGPVGLAMAAELARYGLAVRVVDKAERRTDKSKALVLWSRTLELIDRMGCTAAPFLAAGRTVEASSIRVGDRLLARVRFAEASAAAPHPYGLMLPQSETERLLEAHLAVLGVAVERGTELLRFAEAGGDSVRATLRRAGGAEETVEASFLLGCDGAHSTVRHALGLAFAGATLPGDWLLADVHLAGLRTPPDGIDLFWHAEGVLALFPIEPGRCRVIADVGPAPAGGARRPDPTLAEVQALLDRRGPGGVAAADPVWLSAFRINERMVADYRVGRVFLAGDAAHVHSPAGGQGMNTGIQDACNLAWKLALVRRRACAPEPLLGSYSAERAPVARRVLAATGRATAMATLRHPVLQATRNRVASLLLTLAPVRRVLAAALAEVAIGYPASPLTRRGPRARGGPAAGDRAPPRPGEAPFGAGAAPRFALLAPAGEGAAALIARHPGLLEATSRPPYADGALCLVRPDGYVAATAAADGWDGLAGYLDGLAGGAAAAAAAAAAART